jgi:hypothetical protein
MMVVFIAGVSLVPDRALSAESCDIDATLARLQSEVTGQLNADQVRDARVILGGLCSEVEQAAIEEVQAAVDAQKKEDETVTIFGVEIRKADSDSKGNERLRKR